MFLTPQDFDVFVIERTDITESTFSKKKDYHATTYNV